MIFDERLTKETEYIFGRNYLAELSDEIEISEEKEDEYMTIAVNLVCDYGWATTFSCWKEYLITHCKTAEEALNFAHLFWAYDGCNYAVPEPYSFLGYFYYRINLADYPDEITILDTLSIEVLSKSGIKGVNWSDNPEYVPEKDPNILAEVDNYRKAEGNEN